MENWLPLIISGIFAAFGVAIWGFIGNVLKKFDLFLQTNARKADFYSEKFMGDKASDEMWRQVRSIGTSLVDIADDMIELDSFRADDFTDSGKTGRTVTDLSDKIVGSGE
ncbi:MAG TPA: hypothetical protein PK466_11240 [Thermotogota bacterium]|nr:hypothetical protein [Thermotogota bacterium]HPJ89842.1 hypothetical protein [Thermotogota bacterium]HPR96901.1 hypothetical protein [Thermotogota bacterium]